MKTLDVTNVNPLYTRDELKEAILNAVKDEAATIIITPLPDILLLRPDQYDILQDDPDLQAMYQSKEQLYATPLNVMEVRVKT